MTITAESLLSAFDSLGALAAEQRSPEVQADAAQHRQAFELLCDRLNDRLAELQDVLVDRYSTHTATTPYYPETGRGRKTIGYLEFNGRHLLGGPNGTKPAAITNLSLGHKVAIVKEVPALLSALAARNRTTVKCTT